MPEHRITSLHNPWVKRIRRLSTRKGRRALGQFLAEGTRLLEEAQKAGWRPERLLVAPARLRTPRDREVLEGWLQRGVVGMEIEEDLFLALVDTEAPQGMLAVFSQRTRALEELIPGAASRYLLLENLQDPGNLGLLLRTAQAVQVEAVILVGGVDPFNPKVVRASMGAIFSVPIVLASLQELKGWRAHLTPGLPLVASMPRAPQTLYAYPWRPPFLLALGNEVDGLSDELVACADATVSIPMPGGSESLNTAVAGSVLLYEAWRQQNSVSAGERS